MLVDEAIDIAKLLKENAIAGERPTQTLHRLVKQAKAYDLVRKVYERNSHYCGVKAALGPAFRAAAAMIRRKSA